MSWGAVAGAAISVGGSMLTKDKGGGGGKAQPVDIASLIRRANTQAEENIRRSIELERQYDPATARLRELTDRALTDDLNQDMSQRDGLLADLIASAQGTDPLLQGAYDATLEDLNRGGALDASMHNDVMRGALARGGAAGITGSRAEGGLVARDLGLTAEALRQQRIQAANTVGLSHRQNRVNNLSSVLQGLQSTQGQDLSRRQGIAAMIQSRERPIAGLDPASIADVAVGNSNMSNQARANQAQIQAQNNQSMWNTVGNAVGSVDWANMWNKEGKK